MLIFACATRFLNTIGRLLYRHQLAPEQSAALVKEAGEAGSDDEHRAEVELQKVTDGRINDLDELLKHKEAEILEV